MHQYLIIIAFIKISVVKIKFDNFFIHLKLPNSWTHSFHILYIDYLFTPLFNVEFEIPKNGQWKYNETKCALFEF